MVAYPDLDSYLEDNLDQSIYELSRLVAQPSVGAQNLGMLECAELTAELMRKRGFETRLMPTGGAPVVFSERKGSKNKTLLFYCHYDVQPAEPFDLLETPPFEPSLRDGKLFGRGVSDDKGHITSRLFAIDALLDQFGELPCNIKFIIEGEEETGSIHLPDFVRKNKELLAADACIWEFGGVDHEETPLQYLGLRGICYVELSVTTAQIDVHSGLGGSIFPNSAWRLVWALNTLKDQNERILIPGHYDNIVPPTERDRQLMQLLPETSTEYKNRYGIKYFINGLTDGVDLRIAEVFQPTCTICGLTSGYQGPGSKTVLPAKASAKVNFRLIPNQTPEQILKQLRTHLDNEGFQDVEINFLGGGPAARTDPDDPFIKMVLDTARQVYGVEMKIIPLSGGSGPNYPFVHDLGLPVATAGMGYPDTRGHAPNENIRIDLYLKHARHMAYLIKAFAY
ncbi:MAG: peptidase M20 [Chloroflexi bacterium GWB2_49_20]|nr:MAG: peptidase M20 [Chloroflexi bacterium GWB2_49_20]OGN78149.1 MAG: peptidase M20 [Chloroflexi bacterium GWC2_49_37]OGN85185.1 MAG: peptidase M20 [Chloroflexi bacterium GWD2_49_16]